MVADRVMVTKNVHDYAAHPRVFHPSCEACQQSVFLLCVLLLHSGRAGRACLFDYPPVSQKSCEKYVFQINDVKYMTGGCHHFGVEPAKLDDLETVAKRLSPGFFHYFSVPEKAA